jgi:hypothetical protein
MLTVIQQFAGHRSMTRYKVTTGEMCRIDWDQNGYKDQ